MKYADFKQVITVPNLKKRFDFAKFTRINRKILKVVMWLLIVLGVVAATYLVQREVRFREKAGAGAATLKIDPPSQTRAIGEDGSFSVYLSPTNGTVTEKVKGIQMVITYDPNILQVKDITYGSFFNTAIDSSTGLPVTPGTPREEIKDLSVAGQITYVVQFPAAVGKSYYSSTAGDVAKVTFIAKTSGSSAIGFITDSGVTIHTLISNDQALDVMNSATGGTINVGGASLSFSGPVPANPQTVGGTFTLDILANTGGQNIDAVDAKIGIGNTSLLSSAKVEKGTEAKFVSYPALQFDNTAGTVTVSANIGTATSATPVNGSAINVGKITFKAVAQTTGTDVTYDFTPGSRNDSNIVLYATGSTSDPVDILSGVTKSTIIVNAPAVTATPTPTVTPTPTPTVTPTPTLTPTPTAAPPSLTPTPTAAPQTPTPTPTTAPVYQDMTVTVHFQGKARLGVSNANVANLTVNNKNTDIANSVIINTSKTSSTSGTFTLNMLLGHYRILVKAPGYLAKLYDPITITLGNTYLDLASPLLGGDFNGDNVVNAVDYTNYFLGKFLTTDSVADLDGSGQVNSLDYSIMRRNWSVTGDTIN